MLHIAPALAEEISAACLELKQLIGAVRHIFKIIVRLKIDVVRALNVSAESPGQLRIVERKIMGRGALFPFVCHGFLLRLY